MTQKELVDPVRIWLVTAINSFAATSDLAGVTQDVSAGPRSPWTLRSAYVPGTDELKVGNLWVWTERTTWNPVGGFGDVYSSDIWRNLIDPPISNHPFTGMPGPSGRATPCRRPARPASSTCPPTRSPGTPSTMPGCRSRPGRRRPAS